MKRCKFKRLGIIEAGKYYIKNAIINRAASKGLQECIGYIEEWLKEEELIAPQYCADQKCQGIVPRACDCGCIEGSERCDGINHR